jgi:hypothetical protein
MQISPSPSAPFDRSPHCRHRAAELQRRQLDDVPADRGALREHAADRHGGVRASVFHRVAILGNVGGNLARRQSGPLRCQALRGRVGAASAATGLLGGARMQYHLRQSLTSIDVVLFGRPEVIITFAGQKFDDTSWSSRTPST